MLRFSIAVTLIAMVSATRAAGFGIADTPLPVLEAGQTTLHLYSVTGFIDSGGVGTFVSCTSTDTAPMRVGVEVFNSLGGVSNDPVAQSLVIAPGGTLTFGSSAAGISIDSLLATGPISKGSARILSTSKKLICTAWAADKGSSPPTVGWPLTIVKKTKQKASN
jgi:hypothetical protein